MVDISKGGVAEQIEKILGVPEVDAAVDCVGFEARGCGHNHGTEVPAQVLNDCMSVTRAGGQIGIPGLYVTEDPGAVDEAAKFGNLSVLLPTQNPSACSAPLPPLDLARLTRTQKDLWLGSWTHLGVYRVVGTCSVLLQTGPRCKIKPGIHIVCDPVRVGEQTPPNR